MTVILLPWLKKLTKFTPVMWRYPYWVNAVSNIQPPYNFIPTTQQQQQQQQQEFYSQAIALQLQQQTYLQLQSATHAQQLQLEPASSSYQYSAINEPFVLNTLGQTPPPPPPLPIADSQKESDTQQPLEAEGVISGQSQIEEAEIPFVEYPFPFTDGQHAARFYRYFYKHCTGKSSPERLKGIDAVDNEKNTIPPSECEKERESTEEDCKSEEEILSEKETIQRISEVMQENTENSASLLLPDPLPQRKRTNSTKRRRTESMNSSEPERGNKKGKEIQEQTDWTGGTENWDDEVMICEESSDSRACKTDHIKVKAPSPTHSELINLSQSKDRPEVINLLHFEKHSEIIDLTDPQSTASPPLGSPISEKFKKTPSRKKKKSKRSPYQRNSIPPLMDTDYPRKIPSLFREKDAECEDTIPKVPSLLEGMDAGYPNKKVASLLEGMDTVGDSDRKRIPSLFEGTKAGCSYQMKRLYQSETLPEAPYVLSEADISKNIDTVSLDDDIAYGKDDQTNFKRKWYTTPFGKDQQQKHKNSQSPFGGGGHRNLIFSIASYNVLAQQLLEDNWYLYKHCDPDVLPWEYRRVKLLNELKRHLPEVLCLQEVQEEHYYNFFLPELQKLGYDGIYKKRTGNKPDGCATFYNSKVFRLVESVKVEYQMQGVSLLDRDNIAIVALLHPRKDRSKNSNICVANTHLLYNPKRGDVKLAQLQVLMAEIDKLASKKVVSKPWNSVYHPVILCGDFNLVPYSKVYEFVLKGMLDFRGLPVKSLTGQEYYNERQLYGGNVLGKCLLPKSAGISDQCQFVDVFKDRYNAYKDSNQIAENTKTVSQINQDVDVIELEEGELEGSSDDGKSAKPAINTAKSNSSKIKSSCHSNQQESEKDNIYDDPAIVQVFRANDMASTSNNHHTTSSDKGSVESFTNYKKHCNHCKGQLTHRFNFASVYSHNYPNGDKEWIDEVTTNHSRASCTVDYMFYSVEDKDVHTTKSGRMFARKVEEGKLKLVEKLDLLCDNELEDIGGLPNADTSSDHLMLCAKFLWKLK